MRFILRPKLIFSCFSYTIPTLQRNHGFEYVPYQFAAEPKEEDEDEPWKSSDITFVNVKQEESYEEIGSNYDYGDNDSSRMSPLPDETFRDQDASNDSESEEEPRLKDRLRGKINDSEDEQESSKHRKRKIKDDRKLTPTEHFCMSLATHLDQLSPSNRLIAMGDLQTTLAKHLK